MRLISILKDINIFILLLIDFSIIFFILDIVIFLGLYISRLYEN